MVCTVKANPATAASGHSGRMRESRHWLRKPSLSSTSATTGVYGMASRSAQTGLRDEATSSLLPRQVDGYRRALPERARHIQPAAVGRHDCLADAQPQSRSAGYAIASAGTV